MIFALRPSLHHHLWSVVAHLEHSYVLSGPVGVLWHVLHSFFEAFMAERHSIICHVFTMDQTNVVHFIIPLELALADALPEVVSVLEAKLS